MNSPAESSKEYNVSVHTNDIQEATASVASALYALVEAALVNHENHEAEECEFEAFARDILGVLTRHAEQLSTGNASWEEREDDNPAYD
jgi:hypothetical protein